MTRVSRRNSPSAANRRICVRVRRSLAAPSCTPTCTGPAVGSEPVFVSRATSRTSVPGTAMIGSSRSTRTESAACAASAVCTAGAVSGESDGTA